MHPCDYHVGLCEQSYVNPRMKLCDFDCYNIIDNYRCHYVMCENNIGRNVVWYFVSV